MLKTVICEIGAFVPSFKEEKVLILFGPNAPKELKEISVIHKFKEVDSEQSLIKGGKMIWGNREYSITAVGSQANRNFYELGHISIYFRELDQEVLPGAIFVKPYIFPEIEIGKEICFET
ncbi:MAG: PTS sorbitol transporter subunit IIA [Caldibacillus debilis]|uniref:PTS glucitol/sorbitol transporter subunit IIA n=1 Tax=Caldibacillus debilis TaxID=301148 RepID=UPI000E39EC9E|nr:PTS glucitol/sorbitol transporter subunit IIA [Caldibacillus debilis]REJ13516.1 MAG: PTS sorbitol transporter subunit IIA [Caldibacillus debilis]